MPADNVSQPQPPGRVGSGNEETRAAAGAAHDETPTRVSAADNLQPGMVLNGAHRIDRRLARGGMGEIYRGTNINTGDGIAIKVIRDDLVDDPQFRTLFLREATALRKARHAAIVAYEGVHTYGNGRLYLVMDFVEGPSLAQFAARRPLTATELRALRRRLAEGLQAVHEQGVVHRDLSPDNIILRDGKLEHAVIIDFGIAGATTSIVGDAFAGKLAYAAPEQLGMFTGLIDHRADIYSLGLVLVAAAIGRPLDMGETRTGAITRRRIVPDLSAVPAVLRTELARLLEPDPARRPQSMADLVVDAPTDPRPYPWKMMAAGAACLVLLAGMVFTATNGDARDLIEGWFDPLGVAERTAWRRASADDTVAAYRVFLATYGSGRYAADGRRRHEALERAERERIEDAEWQQAQAANTQAALSGYLEKHPAGRYAVQAQERLAGLVRRTETDLTQLWPRCVETDAERALKSCTTIIEQAQVPPADMARAFYHRAMAQVKLRRGEMALQDFDQAIRRAPDNGLAFVGRGSIHVDLEQYDRALADFDQAVRLIPASGSAYAGRGDALRGQGQFARAVQDYERALRIDGSDPVALVGRGLAVSELASLDISAQDRALQDFDRAIRLQPGHAEAFNGRCVAWRRKKQYDRALQECEQAIRLRPDFAEAFFNRGFAHQEREHYDLAIRDYDQAIRLRPAAARYWNARCFARSIIDQLTAALADCTESLRRQPSAALTLDSRGFIYLKLNELDRAIADYDAALRLRPQLPDSLYGRGIAKRRKGDIAGGDADIAEARRWRPGIVEEYARYGIR